MQNMTFFAFAQTVFAYRVYVAGVAAPEKANNGSDVLTLDLPSFTALLTKFP